MKLKTLIVDDDEMVIFLHKIAVADSGLSPHPDAVINGRLALDYISQNADSDISFLILLDINMPEMDGWEFLDAIQKLDSAAGIYVVMVTSSVDHRDRKRAQAYNQVIDYIEKPLTVSTCSLIKNLDQLQNLI